MDSIAQLTAVAQRSIFTKPCILQKDSKPTTQRESEKAKRVYSKEGNKTESWACDQARGVREDGPEPEFLERAEAFLAARYPLVA